MSSAFDKMLEDTIEDHVSIFGESVSYNGSTITAIVDRSGGSGESASGSTSNSDDSEYITSNWILKVQSTVLTPALGDKVEVDSKRFRVIEIALRGGLYVMNIEFVSRLVVGPRTARLIR